MNVLITGGMGNLGSRLLVNLVQRGERVVLFDIQEKPLVPSPEFEQTEFFKGDITRIESVLEAVKTHQIDVIFHLVSILSAQSERDPELAWNVNMQGTRNVLDAARREGLKKVLFSSSLATYGAGNPEPLTNDTPMWPASLYGVTKVAGECLGNYYHRRFGLDFRAIRFPTLVAPKGAMGAASAFCSAIFVEAIKNGCFEFKIRPDCTFPLIYIGDAINAFMLLFDCPQEALRRRIYSVHGLGLSAEELAASVVKRLPEVKITYEPDPMLTSIVDSWPRLIDDSEAKEDWGWEASYDLDQMADEIIATLQKEEADA